MFVTHDNCIMKVDPNYINVAGMIRIGNNCFIGERSTVLYGMPLADNIIVAAGSVVTKSFIEEKIIIGGNPAGIIGTLDSFYERYKNFAMSRTEIYDAYLNNKSKLISKKVKNG